MKYLNIAFLDGFYNYPAGEMLMQKVSDVVNGLMAGEKRLLMGYGGRYLNMLDPHGLFYAIPESYEYKRWPEIRPFRTIVANDTLLPFVSDTWDSIVALHHLEYTPHLEQVLIEYLRVLSPNGVFIAVIINKNIRANSVEKIVHHFIKRSLSITRLCGLDGKLKIWPYNFDMECSTIDQSLLKMFPFLSDIVIIVGKKVELAPEIAKASDVQLELA